MKREHLALLGQLSGLTRATDGNEHLITPSATATIRCCLTAIHRDRGDWKALTDMVLEEKRNMVPNCFVCANPCGRTAGCDLSAFPEGEDRDARMRLLKALCRRTAEDPRLAEALLYRCLICAGIDDYTPEELEELTKEIS